ncbi:hypothetical protein [Marilutibacter maris]|uniref:Uncharacterized protein n=1 Tax=Marilutibacter maris TaxID=1605891 RepID=A0A2U9T2S6_9GAMM|nr:hypothetical protein [Lysobacter maris]AWV05832.1 hypothetical protein C9I47_0106 [Lysobacter maris]KAB8162828.1 hypothetical protein FKV24_018115 [Lysobacter maris]
MNKTVEQARHAAQNAQHWAGEVGDTLRRSDAAKWLEAGLKIGALRTGARVVGGFARRHPAVAIATVAGAGLLWYAAHRRRKQLRADRARALEGPDFDEHALYEHALEGRAQRVDAGRAGHAPETASALTPSAD